MSYHIIRAIIYAFVPSYSMLMHIGSSKEITWLEFNEEEGRVSRRLLKP